MTINNCPNKFSYQENKSILFQINKTNQNGNYHQTRFILNNQKLSIQSFSLNFRKNQNYRSLSIFLIKVYQINPQIIQIHSKQPLQIFFRNTKNNSQIYYQIIKTHFKSKRIFFTFIILISIVTIALLLCFGAFIQKYIILSQNPIERPFKYICNSQQLKLQISKKFKLREHPRNYIPPILNIKTDLYDLKYSTTQIIKQTYKTIQNSFRPQNIFNQQLSIRLMQVNHNINYQGQFIMDHYSYYSCPEQKYLALSLYLQQEKRYFNQKYQIQKYRHNQIRFCIVVTSFNNANNRIYLRNLDSIFQQQYQNYHVVYIDDMSNDRTAQYVQEYMKYNQIPEQKYKIVKNNQRKFGGYNFYNAAHNYCQLGQILVFVDGDDCLIGRQALALQNAIYQKYKAAVTYGQFFAVTLKSDLTYGWSRPVSVQMIKNGTFRTRPLMTTCHLKTMYVDVYRKIDIQELKFQNGSFINFATDVAFMFPAIQMVEQRAIYVNQIVYEYTVGEGLNQQRQPQLYAHNYVRLNKTKKQKLKDLSFADFPKTKYYQ